MIRNGSITTSGMEWTQYYMYVVWNGPSSVWYGIGIVGIYMYILILVLVPGGGYKVFYGDSVRWLCLSVLSSSPESP